MNDLAAAVALILIPFLAGNICSILNRQARLSVIGRPLARTTLIFCLGIWYINLPDDTQFDPAFNVLGLAPWILVAHFMISLIQDPRAQFLTAADREGVNRKGVILTDEDAYFHGLRYDSLLYSASFLSAICLTGNLGFLILFGESLAVSTWLTATGEDRRRIVKRSLATFVLIALGTGLIFSHTGTADFSGFSTKSASIDDYSNAGRFDEPEHEASLAMKAGVLFLVVGFAWRIGFFPFDSLSNTENSLGGFQRQLSLVTCVTLELSILLPNLWEYENLGLMLLFTLSLPTLVREVWKSTRQESVGQIWECWWKASAALMWISLGLALYSLRQETQIGLWLPSGLEAVRLELLSSVAAYIVLTAVTQAFSTIDYPLQTRQSLTGLVRTAPFYSLVMILAVLSWVGVPALTGFAPRWGAIGSLFEVAGAGEDGSSYFLLIAVIVLCCEMMMTWLGLSLIQTLCDSCPATRPTGRLSAWSVWPFAVLMLVPFIAKWVC